MTIDKGHSAIEFRLDPDSGVPTYLQLVQQVEHALRLGYLKPGDQLPKVRDVVATLTINPNTVLKAYRDLEHKGLAAGRPGQGTFVQATLEQVTLPELAGLRRTLLGWLASADAAGLDEDGIVALFTSGLRDFFKTSGGKRSGGVADRAGAAGVADRARAAGGMADRAGAAGVADRARAAGGMADRAGAAGVADRAGTAGGSADRAGAGGGAEGVA